MVNFNKQGSKGKKPPIPKKPGPARPRRRNEEQHDRDKNHNTSKDTGAVGNTEHRVVMERDQQKRGRGTEERITMDPFQRLFNIVMQQLLSKAHLLGGWSTEHRVVMERDQQKRGRGTKKRITMDPFFQRLFNIVMQQLLSKAHLLGGSSTEQGSRIKEQDIEKILSSMDLIEQLGIIQTTTFGQAPLLARPRRRIEELHGPDKNHNTSKDTGSVGTTELEHSNKWSRVIEELHKPEMELVQRKLAKKKVTIEVNKDSGNLVLQGNQSSFRLAEKMIQEEIVSKTIKEQKTLMGYKDELFSSEEGQERMKQIESENNVVIEITKDGDGSGKSTGWWDVGVTFDERNFRTKEGISVSWKCGNIAHEEADVLVSSANPDISYPTASAKALQEVGGPQYIKACAQYTNVPIGEIATTDVGNLQCKRVVHAVCCNWNKNDETSSKEIFRKLIHNILKECGKCNDLSLAMPAIGTGKHKFPEEVVLQLLKEEVANFGAEYSPSALKEIKIIVYSDKYSPKLSCSNVVQTEDAKIFLYQEDIENIKVDAIINLVVDDAQLSEEDNPSSIKRDPVVQEELKSYRNPSNGSILATSAGAMTNTQLILHVLLSSNSPKAIQMSLEVCLKAAKLRTIHSFAISANNVDGINPQHLLMLIMAAQQNFSADSNYKVDFNISAFNKDVYTELKSMMKKRTWLFFISLKKKPATNSVLPVEYRSTELLHDVSTLEVFGRSQDDIDKTLQAIQSFIDHRLATQEFEHIRLSEVLSSDGSKIARDNNVNIIHKSTKVATVEGRKHNVSQCIDALSNLTGKTSPNKSVSESLPLDWDPQPKGKMFHVVSLSHKSEKYKEIEKNFKDTLGDIEGIEVVDIQRIQNPTLYGQYAVKKKSLEEGHNERSLFHGTKKESVEAINANNFSRSFVRDGVKYGDGVYFAKDASYALNYTQPDTDKKYRYMYMVKVLVGTYTKGESSMKAPPKRIDENNPGHLYDSVVNDIDDPTIFVVFQDAQCYPEYLIIFKN